MKVVERLCEAKFYVSTGAYAPFPDLGITLTLEPSSLLGIDARRREKNAYWPTSAQFKWFSVSKDLAAKTTLCCFGLLPADLYADALQEEVPEAEWAAELLREWAKVERESR